MAGRGATLAALFEAAHGATFAMAETIGGLKVDTGAMRRNLERLNGLVLAERLMLALAPKLGRNEAHHAVENLSRRAVAEYRQLRDLALAEESITAELSPALITQIFDPSTYIGASEAFIDNALVIHRRRVDEITSSPCVKEQIHGFRDARQGASLLARRWR